MRKRGGLGSRRKCSRRDTVAGCRAGGQAVYSGCVEGCIRVFAKPRGNA